MYAWIKVNYPQLSDEDKKFVVDNRESLTIQQIDEKLALAYVKKFVDFSTVDGIPEPAEETTPEETTPKETEPDTPDTGDRSGFRFYVILASSSGILLLAAAVAGMIGKKKKKHQ